MPATLTGDTTGIVDGDAASVSVPLDGEPQVAANLSVPLQYILNRLKFVLNLVSTAHTWTAIQTFSKKTIFGSDTDGTAMADVTLLPTGARRLVGQLAITGGAKLRLYSGPVPEITFNAAWNTATSKWDPDLSTLSMVKLAFEGDGVRLYTHKTPSTGVGGYADATAWEHGNTYSNSLTYAAGWGSPTATAWRDAESWVRITGTVTYLTGVVGTRLGTGFFPTGFRPFSTVTVPLVTTTGAQAWAIIDSSGNVDLNKAGGMVNGDVFDLTAIRFRANP